MAQKIDKKEIIKKQGEQDNGTPIVNVEPKLAYYKYGKPLNDKEK